MGKPLLASDQVILSQFERTSFTRQAAEGPALDRFADPPLGQTFRQVSLPLNWQRSRRCSIQV